MRCFRYFQKTGSPSHNFLLAKRKKCNLQILNFISFFFYLCRIFVYCLKNEYISETCYGKKAVLIFILFQLNFISVSQLLKKFPIRCDVNFYAIILPFFIKKTASKLTLHNMGKMYIIERTEIKFEIWSVTLIFVKFTIYM